MKGEKKKKMNQENTVQSLQTGNRPLTLVSFAYVGHRVKPRLASLVLLLTGVAIHDAVGVVRPRARLQHFGQPLSLGVGVVPEVEEKEQENQAVQADDVDEDRELVVAIRDEEILGDVTGHHNKLYLCWRRKGGRRQERLLVQDERLFRGRVQLERWRTSWMVVRYFFHHRYFW